MKKKMPYVLAGILLMISLVCMACGSTQEATALPDDANESIQDEEDEDLEEEDPVSLDLDALFSDDSDEEE